MTSSSASRAVPSGTRRIIVAGVAGNVMEWYDFAVYGYFATVIGPLFFPSEDPAVSLIGAFGAFAAGFLARPIGALALGRLGDLVGRRHVLIVSVFCMAIPTVLMGLLPDYRHLGAMAPILLVLLRIIQGLSVGGEYTSSSVFLAEHAEPRRRGVMANWSLWGVVIGMLLGSGAGALLSGLLDDAQISDWGWRVPFLAGGLIAVAGIVLRRGISDAAPPAEGTAPVMAVIRHHQGDLLRIIGFNVLAGVGFYTAYVYSVTYIKSVDKLSGETAFDLNTPAMALILLVAPLAAHLSDRIGRRPVLLAGLVGLAVGAVPSFHLIHGADPASVFLGLALLSILVGLYIGPNCAANVEQLPRAVRCTGVSIAYNLAIGIFGGTTPLIAAWLIHSTGDPIAPAFYLIAAALVSLGAVLTLKERAGKLLD
jgi:MHS family proline/betaine transporter-like MFS transporter